MNKHASSPVTTLTKRELKDLKVLLQFTSVYCRVKHTLAKSVVCTEEGELQRLPLEKFPVCKDCETFLLYAFERRLRCPLEDKPICKHCPVHCYKPQYREKVKEIMKFSGQHLMKRGRLDLLWHYFF